ncbi:hypothetical protein KCV06_g632, partial [Aureobasidium melanogenum]
MVLTCPCVELCHNRDVPRTYAQATIFGEMEHNSALPSGHRPYLESVMKTKSGSRRLAHRSETACSREIKGAQLVVTMITTTFDSDLSTTQT